MDPPKKPQPTAAGLPKKPTSTLLDAYEVECIRRELESLLLNHNAGEAVAAASSGLDAAVEIPGLRWRRRHNSKNTISPKNANPPAPAPSSPPAKEPSGGGTRLHLGKHAVKICSGTVAVSSAVANRRRPRRAGYREVDKV